MVAGSLDLDRLQKQQLKPQLRSLLTWHRQTQLPMVAQSVQGLILISPGDIQPSQTCAFQDAVLQSLPALMQQASEPLAKLALTLRAEQIEHLRRRFEDEDQDWRKEWLDGSDGERMQRRFKKAQERLEDYYGWLAGDQKETLRQVLRRSPYQAEVAWQERQRRQKDILDTLERIRTQSPDLQQAKAWLVEVGLRMLHSPVESHWQQQDRYARFICTELAGLHNAMRPEQREKARHKLSEQHAALVRLLGQP
jgi:hypothetical protein